MIKKISLSILISFCSPLVYASSLCEGQAIEKEIFSCQIKKKTLSICKSTNLSKDKGYIQYRYGSDSNKLDIEFPKDTQHPKDHFLAGTQEGNGTFGNLQWIRGNRGDHSYVVYTDTVNKGNEKSGVKVYRNSKLIADLKCDTSDDSLDVDLLKNLIPVDTVNPDGEKVVATAPATLPKVDNTATQSSAVATQSKQNPIENQLSDATKKLGSIFGGKKVAKESATPPQPETRAQAASPAPPNTNMMNADFKYLKDYKTLVFFRVYEKTCAKNYATLIRNKSDQALGHLDRLSKKQNVSFPNEQQKNALFKELMDAPPREVSELHQLYLPVTVADPTKGCQEVYKTASEMSDLFKTHADRGF